MNERGRQGAEHSDNTSDLSPLYPMDLAGTPEDLDDARPPALLEPWVGAWPSHTLDISEIDGGSRWRTTRPLRLAIAQRLPDRLVVLVAPAAGEVPDASWLDVGTTMTARRGRDTRADPTWQHMAQRDIVTFTLHFGHWVGIEFEIDSGPWVTMRVVAAGQGDDNLPWSSEVALARLERAREEG